MKLKLVRVRYNRKTAEEAFHKGEAAEPESREVIGDASLDEYDLNAVAEILYRRMKKKEEEAS